MKNENQKRFLDTLRAIEPLLDEIVFVGGITTYMYLPTAARDIRVTMDVDAIIDADYKQYLKAESKLRKLGFQPVQEVRCRYKKGDLIIDLMPTDEKLLGFTNRWYKEGIKNAQEKKIYGKTIRLLSVEYFFATKIEAFLHRGKNDFYSSKDIEDIIMVLAGRPGVLTELKSAEGEVGEFILASFRNFLKQIDFRQSVEGNLPREAASTAPQILTDIKDFVSGKS